MASSSTANAPDRNLDVLRAVAVLSVLVGHVIASQIGRTDWLWTLGRCSVLLFFVHTAYVLMASLDRSPETRRTTGFYLRRAFRIYPLAIVVIVVVTWAALPSSVELHESVAAVPRSMRTFIDNVLLVQNLDARPDIIGVLWSLPLEVQMYIVLPLCYLVAQRSAWQAIVLWLVAAMFGIWQARSAIHGVWRLDVLQFGPCFMAGVVAWAIRRRFDGLRRIPAALWLPLLVTGLAAFAILFKLDDQHIARSWPLCAAVALLIVSVRELGASWLTKAAHVIAEYSYGIYLLHIPALAVALFWGHGWPRPVQWLVFAVLLVGSTLAAYHWIEKPGIAFGKRLASRWTAERPGLSGAVVPAP